MKKLILLLFFATSVIYGQDPDIDILFVAGGFSSPLDLQHAGDDRLFIVERSGTIQILNADGTTNPTPFIDIPVVSGGEQGLLGLAFHPEYATNGFFYVNYTNSSGNTQISRFTVTSNPDIADVSSEFEILEVAQPFSNHNAGGLAFGEDGFLYIAMGDGGSGGDPGNRAQNPGNLLGKMLRIDVDNQDTGLNYSIPDSNPFVGDSAFRGEIWDLGLRNPFRFSFDPETGAMWIGDVGQNAVEEINRGTGGGHNYGWRCYEGSSPFNTSGCPDDSELTFPVAEYPQTPQRRSIYGGYVYRGDDFPDMQGIYFFGDSLSGEMAYTDAADPGDITFQSIGSGDFFVSYGVDNTNELYIIGLGSGSIYRVIDANVLSIEEVNNNNAFSLYPNPATDELHIHINAFTEENPETILIYDLMGKVVKSTKTNTLDTTIAIQDLARGVYLVQLPNSGITQKLIIQ